jgi:ATP-dependent DNA helicase RecQ
MEIDLQTYFHQENFRPGQKLALDGLESNRDGLVVLPTSTGKSLIFQLAGIRRRRQYPRSWTLVISPLIALIHEQVQKLNDSLYLDATSGHIFPLTGVSAHHQHPVAVFLGAGQDDGSLTQRVRKGEFPFVYVSPEKIATTFSPDFFTHLNMLVVDECHCISEHGKTFRPDYRLLRHHIPRQEGVPTVALTATATLAIQKDVITNLQLRNPFLVCQTMIRPNLHLRVVPTALPIFDLQRPLTGRTLIYALTRKQCDRLSSQLRNVGIPALSYHAGLESTVRQERAATFRSSTNRPVLVATLSYGLGMDVPDIRLLLHAGLPKSLLGYVQEIGRGGRDGQPTECILYFDSGADLMTHKHLMKTEEELIHLKSMLKWARSTRQCRTQTLKHAFGETEEGPCQSCDCCCRRLEVPPSVPAYVTKANLHLLLEALRQTGNHHGRCTPVDFLLGSQKKNILMFHQRYVDPDTVYGQGRHLSRRTWMDLHLHCVQNGKIREICTRQGFVIYKIINSS